MSDMAKEMESREGLNVQHDWRNRDRCRICMKSLKSLSRR